MATSPQKECDLTMVLVGKTGAGKSASGNNILGRKQFPVDFAAQSVTTHCERSTEDNLTVIDTPGLFDTQLSESSIMTQLECMTLSSPGPHVFLLVVPIGRFTVEDQKAVARVQAIFGEEALKHTMVLFTHGDKLKKKNIEDLIEQSEAVQHLIKECADRYHVFNNEKMKDRKQVKQLVEKITATVTENGGQHYTSDMYQQVEEAIQSREEELTQGYKLSETEDLELELSSLMGELNLETDKQKKTRQKKIDELNVKMKMKKKKVREEAEKDFDKQTIIESLSDSCKIS